MRTDDRAALKEQRQHALAEAKAITETAEREHRDLTDSEQRRFDFLVQHVEQAGQELSTASTATTAPPHVGFHAAGDLAAEFRRHGWPDTSAEIGWDEYRAFTWTGSLDGLSPVRRDGVAFGFDQRYLWPVVPQTSVGSDVTAINTLRQTARTLPSAANVVRNIDAVTAKPAVDSTMDLVAVPMRQVAAVQTNVPNIILEQNAAESVIRNDLRLALNEGLDKLVVDAVAASGFQAPGTDPLLISIRKAMSTIMTAGYSPNVLVLRPQDAEALDTLRATTTASEQYYVFAPADFAPDSIFGLRKRISKVVAAPVVMDADAFGRLYASPVRLDRFEADAGTTNRSNIRMEMHAAFGVERQNAAVRIAAS